MPSERTQSLSGCLAVCLVASLLFSVVAVAQDSRLEQSHQFDIDAQALSTALLLFAKQAQLQVVTSSASLGNRHIAGIRGRFSSRTALEQLLKGSGLSYSSVGDDTIVITVGDASRQLEDAAARDQIQHANAGNPTAANASTSNLAAISSQRAVAELEEIIVTARKREETVQGTPVAVTAFTQEALRLRNVDTIDQVARYVPNVQFDGAAPLSGGGFNTTIFIRGIGQNDFATFSDPGVGVYVDGVYLGRTIGGTLMTYDLARVEVLRGPQGSVFGRNTIGGAVNIVSQAPTSEWSADLSTTLGSFARRDAQAVINLPLAGGQVSNRFAFVRSRRDGYAQQIDYLSGERQPRGDQNAWSGRWQTYWHPSETVNLALKVDGVKADQHAAALTLVRASATGVPYLNLFNTQVAPQLPIPPRDGVVGVGAQWMTGDPYLTYGNYGNYNSLRNWGATLTFDTKLADFDLKSISAYRHLQANFARDGDNTPYDYRETFNHDTQSQWSQELQLSGLSMQGKLNWLAGLYFFKEDALDDGGTILAAGIYEVTRNPAQDLSLQLHNVSSNVSYAAFVQATYKLDAYWSMTPGVRITHDRKEFFGWQLRTHSQTYIVPPGFNKEASWDQLTPKVSLEYQADNDALFYASLANGYKSGGFNGRTLGTETGINEYRPEKVWSYELGAKTRWFERRMIANAALFYNDYEDIQLTVNATPQNFVANAAAGRTWGAELETTARIASSFDIDAALGFLHAEYTRIRPCNALGASNPQCLPITLDSQFVKAPKWTLSLGAQYKRAFADRGSISLRADWSYKSFAYQDVGNDPAIAQPAYGIFNAHAMWQSKAGRWQLSLLGTNLTDTRYRISGNASSAEFGSLAESTFAAPREWGVRIAYGIE